LILGDRIVVVEIKLQHMPEAGWQLNDLYRPVVRVEHDGMPVSCLEICRSYDPAMPFPVPFDLIQSLEKWTSDRKERNGFAVLEWRM